MFVLDYNVFIFVFNFVPILFTFSWIINSTENAFGFLRPWSLDQFPEPKRCDDDDNDDAPNQRFWGTNLFSKNFLSDGAPLVVVCTSVTCMHGCHRFLHIRTTHPWICSYEPRPCIGCNESGDAYNEWVAPLQQLPTHRQRMHCTHRADNNAWLCLHNSRFVSIDFLTKNKTASPNNS